MHIQPIKSDLNSPNSFVFLVVEFHEVTTDPQSELNKTDDPVTVYNVHGIPKEH